MPNKAFAAERKKWRLLKSDVILIVEVKENRRVALLSYVIDLLKLFVIPFCSVVNL